MNVQKINKEKAVLFPTGSIDLTRLSMRDDDRGKRQGKGRLLRQA